MAAYKDLVGQKITKVTSNPSEPKTGQMWYNSTSGNLKVRLTVAAAFASGTALPIAVGRGGRSGTYTAALSHHGAYGPGPQPNDNKTFEYDGSSWTAGGNCNQTMRVLGSSGSQTSAMAFNGALNPNNPSFPPAQSNKTESYNGSSWTNETNYPTNAQGSTGCGDSETSTLAFGGGIHPSPTPYTSTDCKSYNGSSWTAEPAMNLASYAMGGAGTETAALKAGRYDPVGPATNQAEEFDGSSWTNVNTASNSRRNNFATGGPQTAAFSAGAYGPGSPSPNIAAAESYDGTSWATMANLSSAGERSGSSLQTPNANALVFGGGNPYRTNVEEFTAAFIDTKSVTTS